MKLADQVVSAVEEENEEEENEEEEALRTLTGSVCAP